MTTPIERLAALDKEILTPTDVAPVLGCHPYAINLQAQRDPDLLGFPVVVVGRRVKIPKAGFLNWYYGGKADGNAE